jgi:hypothetical protein
LQVVDRHQQGGGGCDAPQDAERSHADHSPCGIAIAQVALASQQRDLERLALGAGQGFQGIFELGVEQVAERGEGQPCLRGGWRARDHVETAILSGLNGATPKRGLAHAGLPFEHDGPRPGKRGVQRLEQNPQLAAARDQLLRRSVPPRIAPKSGGSLPLRARRRAHRGRGPNLLRT